MSLRTCSEPGCPILTRDGGCSKHGKRTRNGSTRTWRNLRAQALAVAGHRCTWTQDDIRCANTTQLEVDHIVRITDGGNDTIDNLRVLCRYHHAHRHGGNGQ